ncbi:MAG: hypothetical protein WCP06_02070 [Verrucomicrobiota bacterium]
MKNIRPLILTAATGYRPEQLAPFLESLKRTGFEGTVAILVDRKNTVLSDYLEQNGIEIIPVDMLPRWMPRWIAERRYNGGRMKWVRLAMAVFAKCLPPRWRYRYVARIVAPFHHLVVCRHFYFLDYLRANGKRFSHVLFSDSRDVAFQANPFENIPDRFLWLFQENNRVKIRDEYSNRSWVVSAYGTAGLERIGSYGILCAGNSLGSVDLFTRYLQKMTDEMVRLTPIIAGNYGPDQAVHNYLYWTGRFPYAEVKQNFETVATLYLTDASEFRFDEAGRLLDQEGSPVPVLHQYDRHPALVAKVMARLA